MRIALALLVILVLLIADLRYGGLAATRAVIDTAATPIYWLADLPARLGDWGGNNAQSRSSLTEENERLRRENLVLQGRSQQMSSLQAENFRLKSLLNSSVIVRDDVLVAELIGVSPDPVRHQLILKLRGKPLRELLHLGRLLGSYPAPLLLNPACRLALPQVGNHREHGSHQQEQQHYPERSDVPLHHSLCLWNSDFFY